MAKAKDLAQKVHGGSMVTAPRPRGLRWALLSALPSLLSLRGIPTLIREIAPAPYTVQPISRGGRRKRKSHAGARRGRCPLTESGQQREASGVQRAGQASLKADSWGTPCLFLCPFAGAVHGGPNRNRIGRLKF